MEPVNNIKKNELVELAWKELIQALKPVKIDKEPETPNTPPMRKATVHHPAVITTPELARWEVFG